MLGYIAAYITMHILVGALLRRPIHALWYAFLETRVPEKLVPQIIENLPDGWAKAGEVSAEERGGMALLWPLALACVLFFVALFAVLDLPRGIARLLGKMTT